MNFFEWMGMAVGAYRVMSTALRSELHDWEGANLDGSTIGTSDWPGWIALIGSPPKLVLPPNKRKSTVLTSNVRKRVYERWTSKPWISVYSVEVRVSAEIQLEQSSRANLMFRL